MTEPIHPCGTCAYFDAKRSDLASLGFGKCDQLSILFKRKLDLHQTTFALGESVAHLHRLCTAASCGASAMGRASGALRAIEAGRSPGTNPLSK